ncbi:MAG: ABC transporter ATP-binding protein, partial [Deltaproteobacteria bacterium]|nr:ABC transporter ATP-binding protein [Deltaproteobacteria bacterium]
MTAPALEVQGIVKRFPGVVAVGGVDLEVRAGEIHALLGENGAGKSTLMCVVSGLYRPDAGTIRLDGEPARFASPRDAIARRVGMVHQHFMLVPTLTVAENVVLGLREPRFLLRRREIESRVAACAKAHGLAVDPGALVWQLSVGEQQRVEILKVLYRGARLLILDEPTAVLTPGEASELGRSLRGLASAGSTVVFISHKLEEVLHLADRVTVMRRGRVVAAGLPRTEVDAAALARLMVGRDLQPPQERARAAPGAPVLEVKGLHALGDRGLAALRDVTLQVHAGEIVGIAGVGGNGQRELCEVVTGLRAPTAGTVVVAGQDLTGRPPRAFVDAGVAHVPEDRTCCGVAPHLSLVENLALKSYRAPARRRGLLLDHRRLRADAEQVVADHAISAAGVDAPAGCLSGGNLQRL